LADSILFVEDDASLREIVGDALEARGYRVTRAEDGRHALDQASADEPDLVVLDLGLPDIDGIEVCRHLRRWFVGPIVILSADGDDTRKVRALDEGADDYVTKPFSMPELLARIRVGLRHRDAASVAHADDQLIEVGDLVIDTAAHTVTVGGRRVELAAKEYAILRCLALRPGALVNHNAIFEAVWDDPSEGQVVALRVHLTRIRSKLGTGPATPTIVTEYGLGYRLLPAE